MPDSKLQAALDCLKEGMSYSWYVGYIQQAFKKEYWNEMTVSELEYSQLINTLQLSELLWIAACSTYGAIPSSTNSSGY